MVVLCAILAIGGYLLLLLLGVSMLILRLGIAIVLAAIPFILHYPRPGPPASA